MPILPDPAPSVLPFPASSNAGRILLVRVSVIRPHSGTKHSTYVTIEAGPGDSDVTLFLRAIGEYRHRHGSTARIAAVDLLPNH